ncbi:DUF4351 domain-containing protein [Castellaniella sp.]|uniref:DUF4351 domain-containing protein n=1 Tax=Castellaniella sp. TaxID=1955812 RepID=UPI002AFDD047|nr:DUF4351 domain-containing protein [Castellaniella sp.]
MPWSSWRNCRPTTIGTNTAEGKKEGSIEGQAQFLLRLIQRRFGPQTDNINQRIRTATVAQLETWSLNILDATELDDVFRD